MKAFVKSFSSGQKHTVNQWCDIRKLNDNNFLITSGQYNGIFLSEDEFISLNEYRKQKLNRICLKSEI